MLAGTVKKNESAAKNWGYKTNRDENISVLFSIYKRSIRIDVITLNLSSVWSRSFLVLSKSCLKRNILSLYKLVTWKLWPLYSWPKVYTLSNINSLFIYIHAFDLIWFSLIWFLFFLYNNSIPIVINYCIVVVFFNLSLLKKCRVFGSQFDFISSRLVLQHRRVSARFLFYGASSYNDRIVDVWWNRHINSGPWHHLYDSIILVGKRRLSKG